MLLPVDLCTCLGQQNPLRILLSLPEGPGCQTPGAAQPTFPVQIACV